MEISVTSTLRVGSQCYRSRFPGSAIPHAPVNYLIVAVFHCASADYDLTMHVRIAIHLTIQYMTRPFLVLLHLDPILVYTLHTCPNDC